MLKLKLQYCGHLMQRADSLEETLMLGKIEDRSRRGQQRMRWLDGITDSMDMSLGDGERQGSVVCYIPWGHKESGTTEKLKNNNNSCIKFSLLLILLSFAFPLTRIHSFTHTLKRVWSHRKLGTSILNLAG